MEDPIYHRDLEGIVVNLVNSSTIAQAKPSGSGFDPFERWLFRPFLIFKNRIFPPLIVNDFKFVHRVSSSGFRNPSQVDDSLGRNFAGVWILRIRRR